MTDLLAREEDKKWRLSTFTVMLIVFVSGFFTSVAIESYEDKRVNELKDYCLESIANLQDHYKQNMQKLVDTSQEICDLRLELQYQRGY